MALIAKFEERPLAPSKLHGEVTCGYKSVMVERQRILQLETYGSSHRKEPGKISQSLQIDASAARQLVDIIRSAFPEVTSRSAQRGNLSTPTRLARARPPIPWWHPRCASYVRIRAPGRGRGPSSGCGCSRQVTETDYSRSPQSATTIHHWRRFLLLEVRPWVL
jgi:hypothetical protein